jgi:Rieske Fe-S protein
MNVDPDATARTAPTQSERRSFLLWLTCGVSVIAAALAGIPFVGFLFRRQQRATQWVTLGPLETFPTGETRLVPFDNPIRQPWDGITAHTGVYVRNQGDVKDEKDRFLVLAVNCAHLGCPVSWFPQSGLFMCPCHGGVYYENGERASGPPPRGLFRCPWRIGNGVLEVQAPHYPTLQDTLEKPA